MLFVPQESVGGAGGHRQCCAGGPFSSAASNDICVGKNKTLPSREKEPLSYSLYKRITSHTKVTNSRSLYSESSLYLDDLLSSSRLRVVFGLRAS